MKFLPITHYAAISVVKKYNLFYLRAPTEIYNREDIKTVPWEYTYSKNCLIIQELIHKISDTKGQLTASAEPCRIFPCKLHAQMWDTDSEEPLIKWLSRSPMRGTHNTCQWVAGLQFCPPGTLNFHLSCSTWFFPVQSHWMKWSAISSLNVTTALMSFGRIILSNPRSSGIFIGLFVHDMKDLKMFGAIWFFTVAEVKLCIDSSHVFGFGC